MADEKPGDPDKGDGKKPPDKPKARWPWFVAGAVALIFVIVVLFIILVPHPDQETNDAYVAAHYATVAPRIAGQVTEVKVDDNQAVHAGDLLVAIDDRDQRASLQQAEAALASDKARVAEAGTQVERQPAMIAEAEARVDSMVARLGLSRSDAGRYANLAATGAGSVQQRQQASVTLRQDQASLESARAELDAQRRQLDALKAERAAADARIGVDEAQVAQARLNLSYTRVVAPIDGTVDQRSVQVGDYLSPGGPVMTLAPLDAIYVEANYREEALRHMRPGQHARIHVDAYDIDLDGVVDSLPAGSGASFSPIPPNNATGNFTKIVQRFPVKIVFAPDQPLVRLVRIGMSVETVVDTDLENLVDEQRRDDRRLTGRP